MRLTTLLLGALPATLACAPAPRGPTPAARALAPLPAFSTRIGRDHPLVGRIWRTDQARFATAAELAAAARAARFLVLGERHDQPDHHRLQAWLLEEVIRDRPDLAVGFEMLDDDLQPRLDALAARSPAALARAVDWTHRGWPPFELYAPVFGAALGGRGRILAVHPTRATRQPLRAGGRLAEDVRRRLRLDPPLTPEVAAKVASDITASHCGMLPARAVPAMAAVQELKDAWMAERLAAGASRRDGAALVTGNGHAWRQAGVPRFLVRQGAASVLAVGILEVAPDARTPAAAGAARFDWVIFTPRVDDEDPCAKFRDQLQRLRSGS
ncbi:MAG TPA: ChaN family lipoprotein [Polyangia bacterium]|jgi:uncharacterized iron-regulated protein